MTAPIERTSNTLWVAIDIAKRYHDVLIRWPEGREKAFKVPNTCAGHDELIQFLKRQKTTARLARRSFPHHTWVRSVDHRSSGLEAADGRLLARTRAEALRPLAHLPAFELQDALDRLAVLTQDARQSAIAIRWGTVPGPASPCWSAQY